LAAGSGSRWRGCSLIMRCCWTSRARQSRSLGERQIFALLSGMAREHDKIIPFITHRYDTIRRADTIVALVDGHIEEVGTPEVLERKAGAFWSLYFGAGTQQVR
jgi:ABC-type transport system involved in Fe-S cluster assembly fused permease/ATPase subunit